MHRMYLHARQTARLSESAPIAQSIHHNLLTFVDLATTVEAARVLVGASNGAPEEALAAVARDRPVVASRRSIATYGAHKAAATAVMTAADVRLLVDEVLVGLEV